MCRRSSLRVSQLSKGKSAKFACDISVLRNETRAFPVTRQLSHAHDRECTNTICTPVTRGLVWQLREPNHFSTGHGGRKAAPRSAEWRWTWTLVDLNGENGTERNGTRTRRAGPSPRQSPLATREEAKSAFFEAPRLSSPTCCTPRTHRNSFRAYRYAEFRGDNGGYHYPYASEKEEKKEEKRS